MPPSLFKHLRNKFSPGLSSWSGSSSAGSTEDSQAPPQWTPAPEISYTYGKWNEAPDEEYAAAEQFCQEYAVEPPRLLPSDIIDRINTVGCKAWGILAPITPRFSGHVQNDSKGGPGVVAIHTTAACKDVCLLSDLPIISGLYDIQGKHGIYYELLILKMDGILAVGTACRPYPAWRLPGWNRLSTGLHLDDFRKFFEDPDGGRDYTDAINHIDSGDTIGCGYEFQTGTIFYTYNGVRLAPAFTGIYMPRQNQDVYAAVGVEGCCDFQVNFGGELFRWKEGNEWAWRVEGHVGRLSNAPNVTGDELPVYR
ncbi:hypothetical protein HYPSUDRAFT_46700 [Hypholoma sublateritium FD-334 SS-4]|uniref:B30.2/SPRY domain-containing protein n=1 Tax=Hypholoma sublateritium (strain FD-334 SS-4) TaxID=945553 RepID=A0A0D2PA19_HYPSF|nr:hypothetical protein HYPSUDRAFT_46700 [Hypholoma sublateritium FD-334 SS-4]